MLRMLTDMFSIVSYNLDSGDFVKVEVTRSDEYDLIAEIIE